VTANFSFFTDWPVYTGDAVQFGTLFRYIYQAKLTKSNVVLQLDVYVLVN